MRALRFSTSVACALCFGLFFALLITLQLWSSASAETIQEIPATPKGGTVEINPDSEGNLWIGEFAANTILRVNPTANTITKFSGPLGGPLDARLGPNDLVWYNSYNHGALGRIDLANNALITWTIPGSIALWGLAIDENGNVWSIENDKAILYRFTPGSQELCTFALPNDSKTIYLHMSAQGIWLGDYITDSMIRLNTTNNQLTYWTIDTKGFNSNPFGMTTDEDGTLWWGDGGLGSIGHLEPAANRFTFYQGPGGRVSSPNYVSVDGDNVWWADTFIKQFGVLNPALAVGTSYTVTPTTATLTPTCANLGAGNNASVTVSSQALAFSNTDVPAPNRLACGWAIQPMSTESAFFDIVVASGRVWLSDYGRSTLIGTQDRLSPLVGACNQAYLPSLERQ